MSSAALEKILEEAPKSLSADEQRQLREVTSKLRETGDEKPGAVFWFLLAAGLIHFLEKRDALTHDERQYLYDLLNQGGVESGLLSRADIVRKVRGKYAHLMTSSDVFAAQKREEIELEERR